MEGGEQKKIATEEKLTDSEGNILHTVTRDTTNNNVIDPIEDGTSNIPKENLKLMNILIPINGQIHLKKVHILL